MSNVLVNEAKTALSEAKLEPKCPICGSKVLYGTWTKEFRLDLDREEAEETSESCIGITSLICVCGWMVSL
ncbi:MAG: hypothetical protein GW921_06605 [Gallionella sp.]|nr:hypothetical protein [Gallionella sp.]